MEKLCYLIWRRSGDTPGDLRKRALEELAPTLAERGARGLKLLLADEHVLPARSARLTRLSPALDGLVSFWLDCSDDRAPLEEALAAYTDRREGYLVVESVPLADARPVRPAPERMPGIVMLACLLRPSRLSREEWIRRWHRDHKVVALETQCTFLYVRNTVVWPLTPAAPPFEGLVEEGFPAEAVTNPMLWYKAEGSEERLRENMGRMIESCRRFLDLESVESHPLSEYRVEA